jgi:hypothetical protein
MGYLNKDGTYYSDLKTALDRHCDAQLGAGGECRPCTLYDLRTIAGDRVCTVCDADYELKPYEDAIMKALGLAYETFESYEETPNPVPGVVTQATFEKLVKEIRDASLETLIQRNGNYAPEADKIHNFRAGGRILGKTPAQVALGYMTKHLVSLIDKVERNDFSDRADLLEKCQDIINYTAIIWVCGNEEA